MNAIRPAYELRFQSLFHEGRGLAFPCDAAGSVDADRPRLRGAGRHALHRRRAALNQGRARSLAAPSHDSTVEP